MTSLYQIDAFARQVFEGNPAAVVPLTEWLPDHLLQAIAAENNLAETAFIVAEGAQWQIRWFTPTVEVALCGHATLAAAHVVFNHLKIDQPSIDFITREAGTLTVSQQPDGLLSMSFPAIETSRATNTDAISAALGQTPLSIWCGSYSASEFDYMAVFENASQIESLNPEPSEFTTLGSRGIVATAPGDDCDFVSRYFAPAAGIPEDPVTGSTHCLMAPWWARELCKPKLAARQLSARTGTLQCEVLDDRVVLIGRAVDYLKGTISLPESGAR